MMNAEACSAAACPLSDSGLWGLLRRYYEQRGPRAWNVDGVPNHVTINPGMATRYAHVALRYAQDCRRLGHGRPDLPFPVVELGAGSGGFGFRFFQAAGRLQAELGHDDIELLQVMTDLAPANVASWREHAGLGPLIARGAVTAGRFDVLADRAAGPVGGEAVNPPVFLANYLLDSLPMDLFRVIDGKLHEGLATVAVPAAGDEPPDLSALRLDWAYQPVGMPYYGDPALDGTLADCLGQDAPDYWILFPVGAMRCLERLAGIAGGPALVVAADLGSTHFPSFPVEEPQLTIPGAYFYAPVDFALLARYAARLGAECVHQSRDRVLNITLFSFGLPFSQLHETRVAADTFFDMISHLVIGESVNHMLAAGAPPPLPLFLELAAAGSFDPALFDGMLETLIAELRSGVHPTDLWMQLSQRLDRFAENVYAVPGAVDTFFNIGTLLQEMQEYERAVTFYERSLHLFGESAATIYNIGLCHFLAGDSDRAAEAFHRAAELDPQHVLARGWIAQIAYDRSAASALENDLRSCAV